MFKKIMVTAVLGFMLLTANVFAGGSFIGNQRCESSLIMTQNLKAPRAGERYVRNGRYHWYTKGTVREAHILQKHLNRLGFNAGKVDGVIGPNTKGAILRMQKFLGTKQDGYVGPKTRKLLNNSCGTFKAPEILDNDRMAIEKLELSHKDWEKKYSLEDIKLSKKAYTDNYAYSDYTAGNFSVDAKVNIKDKKTKEFLDLDFSMNADIAVNIPELELDLNAEYSYNMDTNQGDVIHELIQTARDLKMDYRDFMKGELKVAAVVKDLDIYVNIDNIPEFYWNAFEKGLKDSYNKDDKFSPDEIIRKVKKYEGNWIKIEIPEREKRFVEAMVKDIIPELKKQALNQAKIYRESPFMIIDKSSKTRSGKYYSYNAILDLENLAYVVEKISGNSSVNTDVKEITELIKENGEIIKDIKFKVYLDKKTDELRKISLVVDLNLNKLEKDVEAEIFLNLKSETSNISNTAKNNISVPRKSVKWEDIFKDITGKSYEEYKREEYARMIEKANDASVIANMASIGTRAALFSDDNMSYKNVCSSLEQDITGITGFKCNDSDVAWVAESKLSNGEYYCVDSVGNIKNLKMSIGKSLSCEV